MSRPVVCLLLLVVICPSVVLAQGNRRKQAITDVSKAGPDYQLQGEYVGSAALQCDLNCVGLQVVARGDGKFDAVLYYGGLPGAGWDRYQRVKLKGKRGAGGVVQLTGEGHSIQLTNGRGTLHRGPIQWGVLQRTMRQSSTVGLTAPDGAITLFDGAKSEQLDGGKLTDDGYLNVNAGGGVLTKFPVGDFRMHVEFRTPYMPYATGQGRGNSGVYIQRRYEVQILDSFGLDGVANECGGLYRQQAPDLNMCLPPLQWQTYDIYFKAARFHDGKKIRNANLTVFHNGVAVHYNRELKNKTGAGRPEGDSKLPIQFQNHSNPVHLRNVWLLHTQPQTQRYVVRPAPRRRLFPRLFARRRW